MGKTLIGLDINDACWKCVAISGRAGERFTIQGYSCLKNPPFTIAQICDPDIDDPVFNQNIEEWAGKLEQFFQSLEEGKGDLVIGIPSSLLSLRILEVPFSQEAKIDRVLPFEAEGSLPFDTEELVFDFFPLLQVNGSTKVLCASIHRETVSGLLEHLRRMNLDPIILTSSRLCLPTLLDMPGWQEQATGRTAFLNMQKSSSDLSVVEAGRTIFTTSLFTSAPLMADARGQAGENEDGSGEEEGEAPQQPTAKHPPELSVLEVYNRITGPLERTLHFLEGYAPMDSGYPPPITRVVLLGQVSEHLEEEVVKNLGLPAKALAIPQQALTEESEIPEGIAPELAAPLALALRKNAPPQRGLINFRKNEFAYRPERKALVQKLIFPAVLCLLIFIALGFKLSTSGSSEAMEVVGIQGEVENAFAKTFPNTPLIDPQKQIQQQLKEAKDKHQHYQDLVHPSALESLAAVSSSIPGSIDVTLTKFDYKGDSLRISGTTSRLDDPNQITKMIAQVPVFKSVELNNSRRSSENEFRFDVTISLGKEPGE